MVNTAKERREGKKNGIKRDVMNRKEEKTGSEVRGENSHTEGSKREKKKKKEQEKRIGQILGGTGRVDWSWRRSESGVAWGPTPPRKEEEEQKKRANGEKLGRPAVSQLYGIRYTSNAAAC